MEGRVKSSHTHKEECYK